MADTFNWPGRPHSQFQGLLDDIRTSPDEISLRLILADWLHEHADLLPADEANSAEAWSRLLRLQCAREQNRAPVTAQERELLARYSVRWLDTLQPPVEIDWRMGLYAEERQEYGQAQALIETSRGAQSSEYASLVNSLAVLDYTCSRAVPERTTRA